MNLVTVALVSFVGPTFAEVCVDGYTGFVRVDEVPQIPNISNLQDLIQVNITEYLTGNGLIITLCNNLRQDLRCETDTPPLSLLVFTTHEHDMEPALTWSTSNQGTVVMLLIRDMGIIC